MGFLWSWPGAVFFGCYALLAAAVRISDIRANHSFMVNYASFLVGAPGWFILRLFGYEPGDVLIQSMCVTAVLAYLLGAALQLAVGALWG